MKNRALFLAMASALAATACDSKSPAIASTPVSTPAAAVQAPATPPPQQVAQAGASADPRAALKQKYPNLKECHTPDCSVTVTATACDAASIKADPETLVVTGKGTRIVWSVTSSGYTFDKKNGITFKDAAQGQFKCNASDHATQYECVDKNDDSTMTEYKYGITLVNGGKTCTTDPTIVNGT
jgi:hypothetical protein